MDLKTIAANVKTDAAVKTDADRAVFASIAAKQSEQLAQLEKYGEKIGAFKPYDAQLNIPEITGLRTVKVMYRFKDEKKRDKVNSYVRVPNRHLSEESVLARIDDLLPHLINLLETTEDGMIKDLHSKGQMNVYPESLTIDKLIEVLEESSNSGRLSKEIIGNWFNEFLSDSLTNAFAEKLGLALDDEAIESLDEVGMEKLAKLERIINVYKDKLESLASPKVFLKEEDQTALLSMFTKIPNILENSVGRRLHNRISNMKNKQEDDLLTML